MSILAEKKRKVKWCLNPNGNLWVKDSNKFGQKMLEKMGWTPGKGLGAREQGISTALRPKVNSTGRGLGYSVKDDFWMEHQGEFSALLSKLNQGQNIDIKNTSLEERSKFSRGRVHYKKFTRGKDVSRYTAKELSAIIGRAALASSAESSEASTTETYFSMKVSQIESMEDKIGLNRNEETESRLIDSEEVLAEISQTQQNHDSLPLSRVSNNKIIFNQIDEHATSLVKKKKKKKKNCMLPQEQDITEQNGQPEENFRSQLTSGMKKRKKREFCLSESSPKKKKPQSV